MKVLVVGSGGRENALVWKISQSPKVKEIFCAPGNAGTGAIARNVPIEAKDVDGLIKLVETEKIDLTVVGPEDPLTIGIVDEFNKKKLKIFGPKRNAAVLEGSKIFAKQFMERHKIPTADFQLAESHQQALQILDSGRFSYPLVVKADGLAAGKGVIICKTRDQAEDALHLIMVDKKFGDSGNRVIVEEFLSGKEVSFIVISDGIRVLPLATTMDHKAVFDGDKGPNTGGMGAISPSPNITDEFFSTVMDTIVHPTITRMLEEGRKYQGVLYVGLMLTEDGPKVLEYNCRFGDPETQPQMLRMKSDIVELMLAAIEGNVLSEDIVWRTQASGCVILASGGYPVKYEKGLLIEGLDEAGKASGIHIFHAGTKKDKDKYYTAGGRVLGVCACGNTLAETMNKIYSIIPIIKFEGMHYRKDIGISKEE